MNDIAGNLEAISGKQHVINATVNEANRSQDARSRIKVSLVEITKLLEKNRSSINLLRANTKKLKALKASNQASTLKIDELEKLIAQLNKQISDKDAEIADLRDQLQKMNIKVTGLSSTIDTLRTEKKVLQTNVAQKTEQLNTAYYLVGSEKELRAKNIISKQGGFLGIGRNVSLRNNADLSSFTRIDITRFGALKIDHKRISILSHHPAGSYQLVTDKKGFCNEITITDQARFWQISKYLVVVYKK